MKKKFNELGCARCDKKYKGDFAYCKKCISYIIGKWQEQTLED